MIYLKTNTKMNNDELLSKLKELKTYLPENQKEIDGNSYKYLIDILAKGRINPKYLTNDFMVYDKKENIGIYLYNSRRKCMLNVYINWENIGTYCDLDTEKEIIKTKSFLNLDILNTCLKIIKNNNDYCIDYVKAKCVKIIESCGDCIIFPKK